jgi:integrase
MTGPQQGRVLTEPDGGKLKPDTIRIALRRDVLNVLAARFPKHGADKGLIDGRLHSFRHFFCSHCFRCGILEADIKLWLGHTDSKMVSHYRHLAKGEHRKAMEKVRSVNDDGAV